MSAPRSISAPIIAACWWRGGAGRGLPRHRRLLAHRAAGRGAGGERACCPRRRWRAPSRRSRSAPARWRAAARAGRAMSPPRPAAAPPIAPSSSTRVRRETGIAIEIISSDEEARLVVAGCAPLLDPPRAAMRWSSTSAAARPSWSGSTSPRGAAAGRGRWASLSLPHGVVTLSDRYGGRDVTRGDLRRHGRRRCARRSLPFEARHGIAARIAAGRGADARQLGHGDDARRRPSRAAALQPPLRRRLGAELRLRCASASRRLAGLSYEERAAHPCIGSDRADLVLAGCAILEAICRLWPVGRLRVADRGIREGILLGLLPRPPRDGRTQRQSRAARPAIARAGGARQDGARRTASSTAMARAPAQRSLCRRGEAPGLSLARRLQAASSSTTASIC